MRLAKMEVDCILKNVRQYLQVFSLVSGKIVQKLTTVCSSFEKIHMFLLML